MKDGSASPRPIVQVALPLPITGTFSYSVPRGTIPPPPGSRVLVPFGRKRHIGFVVEDPDAAPPEKVRDLEMVLDSQPLLAPEILQLTRWTSDYYQVSWGQTLQCAHPPGLNPVPRRSLMLTEEGKKAGDDGLEALREALRDSSRTLSTLKKALGKDALHLIHRALAEGVITQEERWTSVRGRLAGDRVLLLAAPDKLASRMEKGDLPTPHAKALSILAKYGEKGFPKVAEVASRAGVPQYVFQELEEAGFLELFELVPAKMKGSPSPHTLSRDQEFAVEEVGRSLEQRRSDIFLLFGITGSGKTEVYLRLIEQAIGAGGTALYLVPEISMASFLARRLLTRFGADVAILHSSMTGRERIRQWRRASMRDARVVIGPRSALFAPLPDLRIIIVDEEHDGAYKQQEVPRFHARDMAVIRGKLQSIPVLLGSATPSVESFYNATEGQKYRLLRLEERAGGAALPGVDLIDMTREYEEIKERSSLSRALETALAETLQSGRQAVILRNRLGFSTFVLCRRCGRTVQCGECAVALTFHKRAHRMKCHYCGARQAVPIACPLCGGEVLQFLGEGTERVEEVLNRIFPEARVERMDRDRIRSGGRYDALWRDFEEGAIDILVGTQIVAKGHDVPTVTLVGILSADFLLGMPDFRSAERTFQLITQAAGRAGRGEEAGRVVLQTFHPEHYAVQAAAGHDFPAFYDRDIRYRKLMGYPPVTALARVEARHADAARADGLIGEALKILGPEMEGHGRILGPVEAPIPRLEGRYRRQLLLKAPTRNFLRAAIGALLKSPFGKRNIGKALDVEIDPGSMM